MWSTPLDSGNSAAAQLEAGAAAPVSVVWGPRGEGDDVRAVAPLATVMVATSMVNASNVVSRSEGSDSPTGARSSHPEWLQREPGALGGVGSSLRHGSLRELQPCATIAAGIYQGGHGCARRELSASTLPTRAEERRLAGPLSADVTPAPGDGSSGRGGGGRGDAAEQRSPMIHPRG
ncbi:unnamed protein product [Lampetra planeri]